MVEEASSLVGILETTVELKSLTEKFHDMFVGRPHNISDVSPSNIQGCELHEGEMGQVGAILVWNYVLGGEAKVAKESIDPENNRATYRVFEGDLMKEYKSFLITFQVTPKEREPGSIAHWHFEYEKISKEVAHPETLIQFAIEVSKEIDEHLFPRNRGSGHRNKEHLFVTEEVGIAPPGAL